jgi:formamidopyrimidine-DNA glycosylase
MGTAFSSSLFGLGGSLVLGFIDLQAGHAQNRFFNELEEWLSGVTHLIDKAEGQPPGVGTLNASASTNEIKTQLVLMNQELRENNRKIAELLMDRQPVASPTGKHPVTAMRA